MQRPLIILFSVLALAGCKNSPPASDPFLRTTIPPPGTGTVPPYYGGSAPAAAPAYPAAAPGLAPPPSNRFAPPGGSFNLPQSSTQHGKTNLESAEPRSVANTTAAEGASAAGSKDMRKFSRLGPPLNTVTVTDDDHGNSLLAATTTTVPLSDQRAPPPFKANRSPVPEEEIAGPIEPEPASRMALSDNKPSESYSQRSDQTVIRILGTTSESEESIGHVTLAADEQGVLPAAADTVPQDAAVATRGSRVTNAAPPTEITDLPKPEFRARRRGDVLQASYREPIESSGPSSQSPVPRTPIRPAIVEGGDAAALAKGRYAHTPGYERLHGRLEYSQSTRQWKIRYIPIDGQTDDYGGSVVLADTPALEGFKPGDFIAVQGAIGQKSTARGFSPTYQARLIEPLRQ